MRLKFLLATALLTSFGAFAETQTLSLGYYDPDADPYEIYDGQVYEGTNNNSAPVAWAYLNSGSQTIYKSEDLANMVSSNIKAVKFLWQTAGFGVYDVFSPVMKIYLQEVDTDEFNKNDADQYIWFEINPESPQVQLDYTYESIYDSEIKEVVFDLSENPFFYTGKNLVVTVSSEADLYFESPGESCVFFWCDTEKKYCTATMGSDKVTFADELDKPILKSNGLMQKNAPAVRFEYEAAEAGVDGVETAVSRIAGTKGGVEVALTETAAVQVFSVAGQEVASETLGEGCHTLPLAAGIYVVKAGEQVSKVAVF